MVNVFVPMISFAVGRGGGFLDCYLWALSVWVPNSVLKETDQVYEYRDKEVKYKKHSLHLEIVEYAVRYVPLPVCVALSVRYPMKSPTVLMTALTRPNASATAVSEDTKQCISSVLFHAGKTKC